MDVLLHGLLFLLKYVVRQCVYTLYNTPSKGIVGIELIKLKRVGSLKREISSVAFFVLITF